MIRRRFCTSLKLCSVRLFSTDSSINDELEREQQLRQNVLKRYPGLNMPPITNLEYGSFSCTIPTVSPGSYYEHKKGLRGSKLLIFLLLSGLFCAYGGDYMTGHLPKSQLSFPNWTASKERQAKHILFHIQFNEKTRNALLLQFSSAQQANPLLDFYSWLSIQRPEFCQGRKYDSQFSLWTVMNSIQSESIMARTFLPSSLAKNDSDPYQRLDEFIDILNISNSVPFSTGIYKNIPPNYLSHSTEGMPPVIQESKSALSTLPNFQRDS